MKVERFCKRCKNSSGFFHPKDPAGRRLCSNCGPRPTFKNGDKKPCVECMEWLPRESYTKQTSSSDGYYNKCKPCRASTRKEAYRKDPTKILQSSRKSRAKTGIDLKLKVWEFLKTHPCSSCGEEDILVLDFDHLDQNTKVDGISNLVAKRTTWSKIQEEIDKCEIVCANCHKIRTYTRCNSYRIGI